MGYLWDAMKCSSKNLGLDGRKFHDRFSHSPRLLWVRGLILKLKVCRFVACLMLYGCLESNWFMFVEGP